MLSADAFFWTENDLVVQTRSMYGGTPGAGSGRRASCSTKGGKVSQHFNYFTNERTAEAVVNALVQDAAGLSRHWADVVGGESRAGPAWLRRPARTTWATGRRGDLPAVFLLPGILGSNPRDREQAHLARLAASSTASTSLAGVPRQVGNRSGGRPDRDVLRRPRAEFLSRTHEVIEFAFDWRLPISKTNKRFAEAAPRR